MIFVDPLFQRTLIRTVRENPGLIGTPLEARQTSTSTSNWSGLPVIADEVFTGLYRLGRASSSTFLSPSPPPLSTTVSPDISVHAKLLTAGLLPLALTAASESIFETFLSSDKTDALLHGHSYTAHPIGCMVGNKALDEYRRMDTEGSWDAFKRPWWGDSISTSSPALAADSNAASAPPAPNVYSFFSPDFVATLSHHPRLRGCFALGTVLVLKMAPQASGSGYTSAAAASLQASLLTLLDEDGCGIHSRVLGDVIYFMTSLATNPDQVQRLAKTILDALDQE